MSEEVKKDKIARCSIDEVKLDLVKKTVTFKATLTGKIKSGESWKIENARTKVWGIQVPIAEFITRVLVGWFWVRKVQDVLRKGNAREAQVALDKGYDWAEATARAAKPVTPKELIARGLAAMASMTPEERARVIEDMIAEQKRLNEAEALEDEAEAEEDEDFDKS